MMYSYVSLYIIIYLRPHLETRKMLQKIGSCETIKDYSIFMQNFQENIVLHVFFESEELSRNFNVSIKVIIKLSLSHIWH